MTPDTDAALDFLKHWQPGGPWVLSAIEPDGPIQTRTFHDFFSAKRWIERWQGKRNLYFSVNTPKSDLAKKATKTDIGKLNALHVDLDAPDDTEPGKAKAELLLPRLKTYPLPPSLIIDSGGGLQAYWLMREPQTLNGPDSIAQLEAYNHRLEIDLGGDHCHNIDRIMRLPGTINLPNEKKRAKGRGEYLARVIEADWERHYEFDQFEPAPPRGGKAKANGQAAPPPTDENLDNILLRLPQWVVDRLNDPSAADRSKALFSVIKKLIELDLDDPAIEGIIRAHPGGIGSKYIGRSDLGAEIVRIRSKTASGRKARGKPAKCDDVVTEADLEVARDRIRKAVVQQIADFNQRYSVVNEAGKVWIFEWRLDPVLKREVLDRISHADFRRLYENRWIDVLTADKKIVNKNVADLWLAAPGRRQYLDGVTFDPTRLAPAGYMNLWRGFAVEPVPGNWSLMRQHIESIICAGVSNHADYVFDWLARLFQEPNSAGEVAVVMRGELGCGKGIFGRWIWRAFGQHGLQIFNPTQLVGRFNEHLRDCVFLFADEAFFAGDKEHQGVLKGLITEPFLPIEGKYQRVVLVKNMLHLLMGSNNDWVVPASAKERRFCVLDVPDMKCGDLAYFDAVERQMENGGLAAMLHDLLNRNIANFQVRNVPQTEALRDQKLLSLDSLSRWWLGVLDRGFLWKTRHGADYFRNWQTFYTTELLYRSYTQWCEENRVASHNRKIREQLGTFFAQLYQKCRPRSSGHPIFELDSIDIELVKTGASIEEASIVWQERPPGYTVGDLEEARARFLEIYDIAANWLDTAYEID